MLQAACAIPATAALQEECGLPLGLVVQPLTRPEAPAAAAPPVSCWAADLARCARCAAYINALCDADDLGWACALCGCSNDFSSAASLRRYYGVGSGRRAELPELAPGPLDALCPLVAADPDEGVEEVVALETAGPAVLALVDACCGEEGLELVKSALAAAVEALPPGARFGLLSFGSQVGLHQPGNAGGLVAHVNLEGAEGATANLHEAAPLGTVLTSVGASKPAILAAIDALEAEPPVGGGTERMLGDALRAVLRWVASGAQQAAEEALQERHALQQGQQQAAQQGQEAVAPQQQQWERPAGQTRAEPAGSGVSELPAAQGFPGMRLLLFLSGPPNCGAGSVVKRQQVQPVAAAQSHAAVEEAAKELAYLVLDPAYPELSAWTDGAAAEVRARAAATAEAAAAVQAAAGNLSHAAPPGVPAEALAVDLAAAQFYAEAGAAAAALGISVDLFAACPHWMGLEMIEPLVSTTGGTLLLYTSWEAAALPQDVYKSVLQARAFQCLVRLRTSPELEVRGAHGRLLPDSEHANLWTVVSCDPDDAFAFSLDRTSTRASCTSPTVQLVIQYSQLVPAAPASQGGEEAVAPRTRFVLHRFMRVLTTTLPVASQPAQLYASCDADATACLVVHKAFETAADRGAMAARQMLFDWLVMLAARSAELLGGKRQKADASLAYMDELARLPHLLFALLRGPLLQAPAATTGATGAPSAGAAAAGAQAAAEQPPQWRHPDFPAALRSLLRQLPPDELAVAVCPQLASWSSLEEVAVTHHSLSKAAITVAQQPLYVMDAWCQLIIMYATSRGEGSVADAVAAAPPPFPPLAASMLWRTLAAIRVARRRTPELLMLRQGDDDAAAFAWLIEDPVPAAVFAPAPLKWATFIDFLKAATRAAQEVLDRNR